MARVWVLTIAMLLVSRPAIPGCDNPGSSDGFGDCEKYPGCECLSEVIPCAHGTWFTQYYVDPTHCSGPGPRPPAPDGSGSGSGASKPSTKESPCDMMRKWLEAERNILAAYDDNDLLAFAISQGWGPDLYNTFLYRSLHQGGLPPKGGPGLMGTNRNCVPYNYASGCKWLVEHGLPPAACAIAWAHEGVHVQQCKNQGADYDPTDLTQYRDREVAAHEQTIAAIQKYIDDHCK